MGSVPNLSTVFQIHIPTQLDDTPDAHTSNQLIDHCPTKIGFLARLSKALHDQKDQSDHVAVASDIGAVTDKGFCQRYDSKDSLALFCRTSYVLRVCQSPKQLSGL